VKAVLQGGSFKSRSCRVMVVGPQMVHAPEVHLSDLRLLPQVGKTSLINALKKGRSEAIALSERTLSVHVSRQLLQGVNLRIWDFAGECGAAAFALWG
jgi:hypothetical protein